MRNHIFYYLPLLFWKLLLAASLPWIKRVQCSPVYLLTFILTSIIFTRHKVFQSLQRSRFCASFCHFLSEVFYRPIDFFAVHSSPNQKLWEAFQRLSSYGTRLPLQYDPINYQYYKRKKTEHKQNSFTCQWPIPFLFRKTNTTLPISWQKCHHYKRDRIDFMYLAPFAESSPYRLKGRDPIAKCHALCALAP